jgi:hypothetical protein
MAQMAWFATRFTGLVVVVRWRDFLYGLSEDGGRWEVVEFWWRRASRVSTRSWS